MRSRLVAPRVQAQVRLEVAPVLLFGPAPRVVRRPHRARETAPKNEGCGALGIRRGEEQTHGRAFRDAEHGRAARADCIHDSAQVVHPRLERRRPGNAVRHAGSALVEQEEPREGAELLEPASEGRHVPPELDVRDEAGHVDEVERPAPEHLVGDGDFSAPCVQGFGTHGA